MKKILTKNIEYFLDHFYYQLGHSSTYPASFYPLSFGTDALKDQVHQLYIQDDQDCSQSDVTIAYTAAQGNKNVDRPPGAGKSMCRFEFFEIFLRLAKCKYLDKGKCSTADEAL